MNLELWEDLYQRKGFDSVDGASNLLHLCTASFCSTQTNLNLVHHSHRYMYPLTFGLYVKPVPMMISHIRPNPNPIKFCLMKTGLQISVPLFVQLWNHRCCFRQAIFSATLTVNSYLLLRQFLVYTCFYYCLGLKRGLICPLRLSSSELYYSFRLKTQCNFVCTLLSLWLLQSVISLELIASLR